MIKAQVNRLVVSSIGKAYSGRRVVRDVSFEITRGEVVGILGPNGAGKTTSFYMVIGLTMPDQGKVTLDDYDITYLPMFQRARLGIGYLPQEPSIFRGLNVQENIMAILETNIKSADEREKRLEELLAEFSITHLRYSQSIALSGGERRRLEIARSLATDPSFILLDEPFAGIDPIAISDIKRIILHLKNRGLGVIITDHNVRDAFSIIDRSYIIHDGQVLTSGTPEEIANNQNVKDLYLGDAFKF
jgi:lipopolysaccharide export system ATP-binding protein